MNRMREISSIERRRVLEAAPAPSAALLAGRSWCRGRASLARQRRTGVARAVEQVRTLSPR